MNKFTSILSGFVLSFSSLCFAQNQDVNIEEPKIFNQLKDNGEAGQGIVILKQDPRIEQLVYNTKARNIQNKKLTTTQGFRVQVFSSNQQKTAKEEAYKVEGQLKEKLPQYDVYVAYFSPFWKVRVGNCFSPTEATTIRDTIKKEFPELSKEIYIVKDQVLIPED